MDAYRDDSASASLLHPKAAWAVFDAAYYAANNPAAPPHADPALLREHYLAAGAAAGCSPNRWFDEAFYRRAHADVNERIRTGRLASGFEHYCSIGHRTHAPHWLFDPTYYADHNPTLTEPVLTASGFVNTYDHFLKHGAAEQRLCHRYFDPAAYNSSLDPKGAAASKAIGAFKHFLTQSWTAMTPGQSEPRVSPHFDPDSYKAAHPDAAEAIHAGLWHSALHHYLAHRLFNDESAPQQSAPRIKIHIDRPAHVAGEASEPVDGHLDLVGWAAADQPIDAIDIYIDGVHLGRARHGIRTESVAAAFPNFAHALFAGFRFIAPAAAHPGRHLLRIVARDAGGLEAATEFAADFRPAALGDGPWCLRRRMRSSEADLKTRLLDQAGRRPDFLIVLSAAPDAPATAAERTRASLQRQIYPRWRLHDPSSPAADHAQAPDCWLVPLTPGDELGVDALLELSLHLLTHPNADFLYSDERRIDPATGAVAPFFKPDWSPDLLLATDYIGRLWAATAALVDRAWLTPDSLAHTSPTGDANHDLVLRLTEHARHISHVPLVLCESAPRPRDDGAALRRALTRRGIAAEVDPGRAPHTWRIRHANPHPPRVSAIIPTAGARGLIAAALHSLRLRTTYPDLEILVIDTLPNDDAPWKAAMRAYADHIIADAAPFNWSRLNNQAAAAATGDLLLFLNDDVTMPEEGGDPYWLHTLVGQLLCEGVGIVGPRLLYPGGLVQQAGMFLTRTAARHAFAGLPGTAPGPFGLALATRNVAAVTGACLLTSRAVFDQLGGFDETLPIAGNDVDFCLRCLRAGHRIVTTPHATLTHVESVTRTNHPEAADAARFAQTWRAALDAGDPYFHRSLSLAHTDYRPDPEYIEVIYPPRPLAPAHTIRRILVIKLDHIGDFILALPAIRHLKQAFTNARLTLLADPLVCALAATTGAIDDTIAHPWLPLPPAPAPPWDELAETLRAERFDLAIDLRCHPETRPLLRDCGATWRAGFDPAHTHPWLDIVGHHEPDTARTPKRTHMTDTLLTLATQTTAAFTPAPSPSPFPSPSPVMGEGRGGGTSTRATPWPPNLPAPPEGAHRIAIHPAAGSSIKQWPAAHFAALIDLLADTAGAWFILVGAAADSPLADSIIAALRPETSAANACGLTDLPALAALLAACDLFIGNDSGPAHLAASLCIPTLAIHAGVIDAPEWSPLGRTALAIRRRVRCSPCYLPTPDACPRALACLNELTPTTVLDYVNPTIASREPRCF